MEETRILIADESEEFIDALSQYLAHDYHLLTTCDGNTALAYLREFRPDALVLDLILPGLDGLSLLSTAAQEGLHPLVLASTRFLSDYISQCVSTLDVSYLMMKPCEIGAVASRVRDMLYRRPAAAASAAPDPRLTISSTLLQLGFSTKRRGYGVLREAILVFARDPGQSITKELYPALIAQCTGTTIHQVEHSIRSAIHDAWEKRDDKVWQQFFPVDESGIVPCPTNAAFISRMADPLSLAYSDASANHHY